MPINIGPGARAQVVFSEPTGDNPRTWDTNLELHFTDGLTDSTRAAQACDAIAFFFQRLLMPPFVIDHIVLDDLDYEGVYDPSKVLVRPYNLVGQRPDHTDALVSSDTLLGLTDVLKIRKEVDSGYPGRLDIRGFLCEIDVVSSAQVGTRRLANVAELQDEVDAAWGILTAALEGLEARVAMYGEGAGDFDYRSVNGLTVTKAGVRQLKNNVSARYGTGLFGTIMRAIDTVKGSQAALEAIAQALDALGFLGSIVGGAQGSRKR